MRKLFVLAVFSLLFLFSARTTFAQIGTVFATVRPNPLEVKIPVLPPVAVGQWFIVSADISNLGVEAINAVSVSINNPQGVSIKGKKTVSIGNLSSGGKTTVSWEGKANSPGNFVILVEATGNLAGEVISASDSTIISATGSLGAFLLRLILGS